MEGYNGTTLGGEAICRVCCSWSALGWVDVVTKTSLCSALFRCWPSALRLTCFGNMDEEMKTWACSKDLNLKMAGPGEGFWVQACRSCKRGLVFTSKLIWNIVKVFLPVQPLPTQKKFPHWIKWLQKHELTNQPENRVNLEWIHFILYHCHFSTVGTHISTIKIPHSFSTCAFLSDCLLLASYWWAYSPSCKRLLMPTKTITHLQCRSLCFIILKLCLTRLHFTAACWSDTKLWENHWCDATVVYDFRRKDPGWKLSGGIPSKLS